MVEPQLDGDLRRIRSGGDLGFLYHNSHDLNRSNAKMMKQKKKHAINEEIKKKEWVNPPPPTNAKTVRWLTRCPAHFGIRSL